MYTTLTRYNTSTNTGNMSKRVPAPHKITITLMAHGPSFMYTLSLQGKMVSEIKLWFPVLENSPVRKPVDCQQTYSKVNGVFWSDLAIEALGRNQFNDVVPGFVNCVY